MIDKLNNGTINRNRVVVDLMTLDFNDHEQQFIKVVCNMLQMLTQVAIRENMIEFELCAKYIEPLLSGLFDLGELPRFVADISKVIKIFDVFHRVCVPSTDPAAMERKITTPTQNLMDKLFMGSQDCNREPPLKLHYS